MKIHFKKNKPPKIAYYVEVDTDFGTFDWNIVFTEREAKNFSYYRVATIKELIRYYNEYGVAISNVIVREGIARFDYNKKEFFVKRIGSVRKFLSTRKQE